MIRRNWSRYWRKCRYLGGECCVQRKHQVQCLWGRAWQHRSLRHCENGQRPSDRKWMATAALPSLPCSSSESCWLRLHCMHPIHSSHPCPAQALSSLGWPAMVACLTGLPPATLPVSKCFPHLKLKISPWLTTSWNPAYCSCDRFPTSPCHAHQTVVTWSLPTSAATSLILSWAHS